MSVDNLVVYTGVRASRNQSDLNTLNYERTPDIVHSLNQQNDNPRNPLRGLLLTPSDFNMTPTRNDPILFSFFIRSYGHILKDFPKNVPSARIAPEIDVESLGTGTYGSVFKIQINHDYYILKCMSDAARFKRQNRREIKILFYLNAVLGENRWCIVNQLAATFHNDVCFLLYAYVPGLDLFNATEHLPYKNIENVNIENVNTEEQRRTVVNMNDMDANRILWIKKIADLLIGALACIHSVGIIHNDIKPENIMIPDDDTLLPFFIDFGFAAFLEEGFIYNKGTRIYLNPTRPRRIVNKNIIRPATIDADLFAMEKTLLTIGIHPTEIPPYIELYIKCRKNPGEIGKMISYWNEKTRQMNQHSGGKQVRGKRIKNKRKTEGKIKHKKYITATRKRPSNLYL